MTLVLLARWQLLGKLTRTMWQPDGTEPQSCWWEIPSMAGRRRAGKLQKGCGTGGFSVLGGGRGLLLGKQVKGMLVTRL